MAQSNSDDPNKKKGLPNISKSKSTPPSWARPKRNDSTKEMEEELRKHGLIPLKEKRKLYLCQGNFLTLDNICLWPLQWKMMREKSSKKPLFPVNHTINMKISLTQNDITKLEIDAIVNAANNGLRGGGGVDGCIHRAAGKSQLNKACLKLNGCDTGCSKITPGFNLPAKYIIHTVGPVGENVAKLKSCYESALTLAEKYKIKTIAFCCISTGIYGYPNDKAAQVALETTRKWLEHNGDKMDRVIFCTFLNQDFVIYESLLPVYFPCKEVDKTKTDMEASSSNRHDKDTDEDNDENDDKDKDKNNDTDDDEQDMALVVSDNDQEMKDKNINRDNDQDDGKDDGANGKLLDNDQEIKDIETVDLPAMPSVDLLD